jgi:lipoic acid synthetase
MITNNNKPAWIRTKIFSSKKVKELLRANHHVTVCEAAACPNLGECFHKGTATFMIMGDICTRNCGFCNVKHGCPLSLDLDEPQKIAATIAQMKLRYAVLTSVDRDDLSDGGATHFANCVNAIRQHCPQIKIEILTPDFRGCMDHALEILATSPVEVFNHNIETAPRLYPTVCPSANYQLSLELLRSYHEKFPHTPTKSGMMLGLGETDEEVIEVLKDLRANGVKMLTMGQYLQPHKNNLPVARYVTPEQFNEFAKIARAMGFANAYCGPLVRSSYNAEERSEK